MALGAFHLLISDFSTGKKKTDDLLSDGAARGPGPQHGTARRDQVANHRESHALTAITARRSVLCRERPHKKAEAVQKHDERFTTLRHFSPLSLGRRFAAAVLPRLFGTKSQVTPQGRHR